MLDHETLQRLTYAITEGIEYGMKNGAAHIAEALAKPAARTNAEMAVDRQVGRLPDGVTWSEFHHALKIVVESNTRIEGGGGVTIGRTGRMPVASQIGAWTVLRKALNLPV